MACGLKPAIKRMCVCAVLREALQDCQISSADLQAKC